MNGAAEKELVGAGAHGYATESLALQKPNAPATAAQATLLGTFLVESQLPFGGSISGVLAVDSVTAPKTPANNQTKTAPQAQQEIAAQTKAGSNSPATGLPSGTASPLLANGIVIILGIFIMTFIAGLNDSMGKAMTALMGGWLLVWMVSHEGLLANWTSKL